MVTLDWGKYMRRVVMSSGVVTKKGHVEPTDILLLSFFSSTDEFPCDRWMCFKSSGTYQRSLVTIDDMQEMWGHADTKFISVLWFETQPVQIWTIRR